MHDDSSGKELSEDHNMACGLSFRTDLLESVKSLILTKVLNSIIQSVIDRCALKIHIRLNFVLRSKSYNVKQYFKILETHA